MIYGGFKLKSNNYKLKLYYNLSIISKISYILCAIVLLVPIFIVLITDVPFDDLFTRISISSAYLLFLIGKTSNVIKKKLEKENISIDIGVLLGILLGFITYVFKIKLP